MLAIIVNLVAFEIATILDKEELSFFSIKKRKNPCPSLGLKASWWITRTFVFIPDKEVGTEPVPITIFLALKLVFFFMVAS